MTGLVMRRFFAILVFGCVAAASGAGAADLSVSYPVGVPAYGVPASPVLIYDVDCGVTMRAYWEPPWADRHYFPATGKMPKIGRREIMMPHRRLPKAESFSRSWSTSSGFAEDAVPLPPPPPATRPLPAPAPLPPERPQ